MRCTKQFRTSGSIHPLTLIEAVAGIMRDYDVNILPVVDDDKLKGILTSRDLVLRCLAEGRDVIFTVAEDYMTRDVDFCQVGQSSYSVAARMKLSGRSKFPLIGTGGRFLGMIDFDVCRRAVGPITADLVDRQASSSKPAVRHSQFHSREAFA